MRTMEAHLHTKQSKTTHHVHAAMHAHAQRGVLEQRGLELQVDAPVLQRG